MSVQTSTSKIAYVGNASTITAYTVPFVFALSGDLRVLVTTAAGVETLLTETTDYVVTGAANPAGGSLVTVVAVPNTSTVTIYREVSATQTTSYVDNDSFPAASHEGALDKLTFLMQQALRKIGQCLSLSVSSTTPAAAQSVPLSVAGLDASGNLVLRTAAEMTSFLSLSGAVSAFPGATWANAGERAAKVPDYLGQLGYQRDTAVVYYSTALTAGSWTVLAATTAGIADASVTTAKIADLAVTQGKIALGAVYENQIGDSAVTGAKMRDATITGGKMGAGGLVSASISTTYATNADLTTVIPLDDTIPQNTEGTQVITLTYVPSGLGSVSLRIRFTAFGSCTTAGASLVVALFNNGTSAIAATSAVCGSGTVASVSLTHKMSAFGLGSNVFTIRVGASSGTARLNGTSTARLFGGVAAATLTIEEITN